MRALWSLAVFAFLSECHPSQTGQLLLGKGGGAGRETVLSTPLASINNLGMIYPACQRVAADATCVIDK